VIPWLSREKTKYQLALIVQGVALKRKYIVPEET
jgi:hypothetical protein